MNKVKLYISMTLDWYISRKDWKVDFLDKYNWLDEDYWYSDFYSWVWAIIMWNTTYKEFWHTKEFKDFYKWTPIYVFSKKEQKNIESEENIIFCNWKISELTNNIKLEKNKYIWLLWWAWIFNSFSKEDLIDELIITILPEFIWEWISLFWENIQKKLDLIDAKKYKNWVVQLSYKK